MYGLFLSRVFDKSQNNKRMTYLIVVKTLLCQEEKDRAQ